MADWLESLSNIKQGGLSGDPAAESIAPLDVRPNSQEAYWAQASGKPYSDVEAVPFGSILDPVSQIAFLAAPWLKAFLGREAGATLSIPGKGLLQSQRGNTGQPPDESTLAAFKRMFMERGGVEAGEGKAIPSKAASAREMLSDIMDTVPQSADLPIRKEAKTILDKGIRVLEDYHAIDKASLKEELTQRYGNISQENIDRLWDTFVNKGIIDPKPGTNVSDFGYHTIHHNVIGESPK